MKTAFLNILFFLGLGFTFGQELSLLVSPPYKLNNNEYYSKLLKDQRDSTILLRQDRKGNEFSADLLGKNLGLINTNKIYNGDNAEELIYAEYLNNELITITSFNNKKEDLLQITGTNNRETNHLIDLSPKKLKNLMHYKRTSPNRKLALISFSFENEVGKTIFKYFTINSKLEKLDYAEIEIPVEHKEFKLIDSHISDQGDLHFVIRKQVNKSYHFNYITFFKSDGNILDRELKFSGELPKYIQLTPFKNGLTLTALLTDNRLSSLTSYYLLQLDYVKRDFINEKKINIQPYLNKTANGRSQNFFFHPVLTYDNGLFLTLEYFATFQDSSFDAFGNPRYTTYYYCEDLLILKLNPQFDVSWDFHIPKKQLSINNGAFGLGTAQFVKNNRLYLLFNSNIKNRERNEGYKTTNLKKSNLVGYGIKSPDQVSYHVLNKTKETGATYTPSSYFQLKNGILVNSQRGAQTHFTLIK